MVARETGPKIKTIPKRVFWKTTNIKIRKSRLQFTILIQFKEWHGAPSEFDLIFNHFFFQ